MTENHIKRLYRNLLSHSEPDNWSLGSSKSATPGVRNRCC